MCFLNPNRFNQDQVYEHCFCQYARSCGQGYVFTRVCDSVHGGGLWRTPPGPGRTPPRDQGCCRVRDPPRDQGEPPPPDQADYPPPPGQGHPPLGPGQSHPPWTKAEPPRDQAEWPNRKKTAAYGQWAAGTHPTWNALFWLFLSITAENCQGQTQTGSNMKRVCIKLLTFHIWRGFCNDGTCFVSRSNCVKMVIPWGGKVIGCI